MKNIEWTKEKKKETEFWNLIFFSACDHYTNKASSGLHAKPDHSHRESIYTYQNRNLGNASTLLLFGRNLARFCGQILQ